MRRQFPAAAKLSHPLGIGAHDERDDHAINGGERERALARFAAGHDSVFRVEDARAPGLTKRQIGSRAAKEWTRLHEGIYRMPGVGPSWRSDLRAAVWAGGDLAAVSHRSAAAWFEVPGARTDVIEIMCKRWERTRAPGLVVHEMRRLSAADIIEVDGISLVRPELLVMQLAWWKPVPTYVEAVIHALRRKRLISYSSTEQMFARHTRRGLRGVAAMRTALEWWNPANAATASEMETLLFQTFRAHDLPEPVLQFEVYDRNGQFVARVDAGLPEWKVVVEYQSMQEHLDEFQIARDDRRRNKILAAGYFPLMARAADLRTGGHELVEEILAVARRDDAVRPRPGA